MSLNHVERIAEFLPKIVASDPSSSHAGTTRGSFARAPKNRSGTAGCVDVFVTRHSRNAAAIGQNSMGFHASQLDVAGGL